ncbi:HD domain-containing protein [Kitasatospora sp. GP82]|uniref:HD domain-containing protein n=1 Tax=Kitasatospora sp. GP82 TaxID=3035089 RepID=UPI002473132E|nr:HD domain-containing protein [Kitasatospora sp. GP82]MDH6128811.1 putative hydrolase of HD superfamily [Kitasatospora sp. GP82]
MTEQTSEPRIMGTAALLFEAREAGEMPRTGWRYDGVPMAATETVADHSHSTAVIGLVLAAMEGANPERTTMLCVLHDLPETRTGDQTPVTRRYVTATDPRTVAADQVAAAHPDVRDVVLGAIAEFEDADTPEARCAHDADKLDCYLQGLRLLRQGHRVEGKVRRCREALRTASAQRLAAAAETMDPAQWQHDLLRVPASR